MGDAYGVVKVAAVQAASVFLDREGSTAKACRLIREAGRNGARVIGFPEGFIPAHPVWYHHHSATGAISNRLAIELFKNAVEIPGPETDALGAAARDANAYVVVGVCEKMPNTFGTMFNTQVYFGPDGTLIGKHQKIMPTVGERLVHTGGFGDTFGAFQTEFGPMSGADLRRELQSARGVRADRRRHAHPRHELAQPFPGERRSAAQPRRDRRAVVRADEQGVRDRGLRHGRRAHDRDAARPGPTAEKFLRDPDCSGGSCIVAPNSRIIAGPMGAEEGILYADCDLEIGIQMKLRHDFAGHYNRPDIFHLHINRCGAEALLGARRATALLARARRPRQACASRPGEAPADSSRQRTTTMATAALDKTTDPRVTSAIAALGAALRHQRRGADRFRGRHRARSTSWDDWCRAWSARAAVHEEMGREALANKKLLSAGEHLQRAGVYYHFGKFLFVQDLAQMKAAHMKAVECRKLALPYLRPPGERVEMPYEGKWLAGILRKPDGRRAPAGARVRLRARLLQGGDRRLRERRSWRAGSRRWCSTARARAKANTISRSAATTRSRSKAVIDYVETRRDLDATRVGIAGISLGGYYAPRAAAFDKRIKACLALGGPYDWGECFDGVPDLTREAFRVRSKSATLDEARRKAATLTLKGVRARTSPARSTS